MAEYISSAILTLMLPNIPIVLTTPGNIFERIDSFNPYGPLSTAVLKWAAPQSARRCARIIATSQDMRKWWEYSGASTDKVVVIPLAVNTDLFYRRENARKQLGWGDGERHLLFVGRLDVENRVERLLESAAKLRELTNEHVRLHIVGDGPQRQKLEALSSETGNADRITWHGEVGLDQLPFYYSATELFVFSRPTGAPPRVIPQAMACGAPVVSIASKSAMDYVLDGYTGKLVDAVDGHALANGIVAALRDPTRLAAWGQAGMRHALENYAIGVVVKRIRSQIYEPLLIRSSELHEVDKYRELN